MLSNLINKNKNNREKCEGAFKSHEPIYDPIYLRYPYNSISSLSYLWPMYLLTGNLSYLNVLGIMILSNLSIISALWWAHSLKQIKYWDNVLVIFTLVWMLSVIIDQVWLNLFSLPILSLDNDSTFRYLSVIFSVLLLYCNSNYQVSLIFILALLSKLSDSIGGMRYGTALFHCLTSLCITYYCH
jgi:hypothetical protein